MNLTTFDPCKPVQTRAGKPATILCVDLKNELYPIGARFTTPGGDELLSVFTKDGRYSNDVIDSPNDLLNVGERITACGVLNVYPGGVLKVYNSQDTADAWSGVLGGRITSIPLTVDIPKPQ